MGDPELARAELARIMAPPALPGGTKEAAVAKSAGCISWHGELDEPDMHTGRPLAIGCVDCHGGNATVMSTLAGPGRPGEAGTVIEDEPYITAMFAAHVQPRNPTAWYGRHHLQDGRPYGEHRHQDPNTTAQSLFQL